MMNYVSPNFLTFIMPLQSTSNFPEEFYEEIEMLGLTDKATIDAHAKNKGYKSAESTKILKISLSRDDIESLSKVIECSENPNWTNLELESGEILTVIMDHDDVIEYVDNFIFLIYDIDEEIEDPKPKVSKKEKVKIEKHD